MERAGGKWPKRHGSLLEDHFPLGKGSCVPRRFWWECHGVRKKNPNSANQNLQAHEPTHGQTCHEVYVVIASHRTSCNGCQPEEVDDHPQQPQSECLCNLLHAMGEGSENRGSQNCWCPFPLNTNPKGRLFRSFDKHPNHLRGFDTNQIAPKIQS